MPPVRSAGSRRQGRGRPPTAAWSSAVIVDGIQKPIPYRPLRELESLSAWRQVVEEERDPLTEIVTPEEVLPVVPSGMLVRTVDASTERSSKEPEWLGIELMQFQREDRSEAVPGE